MDISVIVKIGLIGLALAAFGVSRFIFKAKDDAPVEQLAEKIIKDQTGLDIDLTPTSH